MRCWLFYLQNIERGCTVLTGAARRKAMSVSPAKTVRQLALEFPNATRVFEKLGIDYCCGGNKSLDEACSAANLSADKVLDSLEVAEQASRASQNDRNWQTEPL